MPQALWPGKEPTYDRLHIFGCEAYAAFIPRAKRTKLSPHAMKCIFLSYGTDGEFGYKLWDPENRKLIRSSDIEKSVNSKTNLSNTKPNRHTSKKAKLPKRELETIELI